MELEAADFCKEDKKNMPVKLSHLFLRASNIKGNRG